MLRMKRFTHLSAKELFKMFAVFFKIGLFSFGGGYAMLTMIEHEVVDKRAWLTHDELLDVFAIAESTPGAISINIATFIGTKRQGLLGGVLTTLGVVLPSFLVILALSYVIDIVRENVWVGYLFRGIRIGALVLIVRGAVSFVKNTKKKIIAFVLMAAMFLLALFTEVSVIYLMLGAIGISIVEVVVSHAVRSKRALAAADRAGGEYVRGAECSAVPEGVLAVNMPDVNEKANAPAESGPPAGGEDLADAGGKEDAERPTTQSADESDGESDKSEEDEA